MLQYLSVTQTEIQELMEEVVALQLENDDLEEEKQELKEAVETKEESMNVKDMEKEVSDKEVSWKILEKSLRNKIATLEAEVVVLKESRSDKSKTVQDTIRTLELTVASRTRENVSLRKQLDEAMETESGGANQVKSLENQLSNATTQSSRRAGEIASLQKQTQTLQKKVDSAEKGKMDSESRILQLEAQLAANDVELSNLKPLKLELQTAIISLESKLATKIDELSSVDKSRKSVENQLAKMQRQAHEGASNEVTMLMCKSAELATQNDTLSETLQASNYKIAMIETKLTDKELELSVSHEAEQCLREDLQLITKELEQSIVNEQCLSTQVTTLAKDRDAIKIETKKLKARVSELESELGEKDAELSTAMQSRQEGEQQAVLALKAENLTLSGQLNKSKTEQQKLEQQLATKEDALREASKSELRQQRDIHSLRSELRKAQTATILKDDEIRDLRLIELKDCEEEVAALEEKLQAKETEFNSLVRKLETISFGQLEREHEVSEEVSKLKASIATLKREHQEKEVSWLASGKDAQELKSQKRRNQLLEKSISSARKERDLILASERSAVSEKQKLESALQREVGIREEKDRELTDCKLTIDSLEKSVSTMSGQKMELAALLDDRKRELMKIVKANAMSGSQNVADKLRDERDELIKNLSCEQTKREVLEAEVSTAHAHIASIKKDLKAQGKLKEENKELQAKVRRQEAFLKKKLQKEKAMKRQSSSFNVLKAPANIVSPTKRERIVPPTRRVSMDVPFVENLDPNIALIGDNEI